jgi:signal transduction histidine kinase
MLIRIRLTLLYTAILALTLILFGIVLYTIQDQYTLNSLKRDLSLSGDSLAQSIIRTYLNPNPGPAPHEPPPPKPIEGLSGGQAFRDFRERDIMRVLDANGALVAGPFGGDESALPISAEGLQVLQDQRVWWESITLNGEHMLVYNRPLVTDGKVAFIIQAARSLTERDRSLTSLGLTLIIASLVTTLVAFGIGWLMARVTLSPIQRVTQTAQMIGNESDFTRRVDYSGPQDEVGQLATTFNEMLTRLQDAYQRVSQALKMQRDFVADVSHELRTPLTTVRGNLALLRRTPPLPADDQTDILADLVEESDRLIRLVNNLLVLARADAGQCLGHEPVHIRTVIEESCRQARLMDLEREIVEVTPQDIIAVGDRDALKQVLLIVLDNALKYSQGKITVRVGAEGTDCVIGVSDEGPGIDPDVLPHLFDRFYRGDTHATTPGIGLGLSIAKTLVEGQCGSIAIESQSGQATQVWIHLPLWVTV